MQTALPWRPIVTKKDDRFLTLCLPETGPHWEVPFNAHHHQKTITGLLRVMRGCVHHICDPSTKPEELQSGLSVKLERILAPSRLDICLYPSIMHTEENPDESVSHLPKGKWRGVVFNKIPWITAIRCTQGIRQNSEVFHGTAQTGLTEEWPPTIQIHQVTGEQNYTNNPTEDLSVDVYKSPLAVVHYSTNSVPLIYT